MSTSRRFSICMMATNLAAYWERTTELTPFERVHVMSIRAVSMSDGKPNMQTHRPSPDGKGYVEDVAEEEMDLGLLRGLVPCRDTHA